MAGMVSVREAVRLAKDALGDAPPQELAGWISTAFGMTIKPVMVTVMLGSFMEQEQVKRLRQAALEMVAKANAEPAEEKPKKGKKFPGGSESPDAKERKSTGSGCPDCASADYVFRGRRKVAPEADEQGPMVETKRACRACGYQWKVRTTV